MAMNVDSSNAGSVNATRTAERADLGTQTQSNTGATTPPPAEEAKKEAAPQEVVDAVRAAAKGVEDAIKRALGLGGGSGSGSGDGIDHSQDEAHVRRPCPRGTKGSCVARGLQGASEDTATA
jgi:hypothetical protein